MTATVVVVGSINIDESISVRHQPAPGETIKASAATRSLGGKGANQAVAAARAGAMVRMVGAVGTDDTLARRTLDADGVDTAAVATVDGTPTGRAVVLVDDSGENSIIVLPGTNADVPPSSIDRAVGAMHAGDVLVLQNEIPARCSARAARIARARGATVIWNAAPAPTSRTSVIEDVDVLVVNEHELAQVAALIDARGGDVDTTIAAVADVLGTDVVCTLGATGVAFRAAGTTGSVPAHRVRVADTTAAGDTFVGFFAASTALLLPERVRFAVAASAVTVTRRGASTAIPTRQDVDEFLAANDTRTRTNA